MKRLACLFAALVAAGAAAAANIPNALDEKVLRLGPLGGFGFQKYEHWYWPEPANELRLGGGGYFWAQYDGTWYGYDARLGAMVFSDGGSLTQIDWENEYAIYLVKGKFRPYVTPAAGLRRNEGTHASETTGIFGLYFGIRLNSPDGPFHMTFGGGYKFADEGFGIIQNRYFMGLSPWLAVHVRLELATELGSGDSGAYGRLEAGPAFSF